MAIDSNLILHFPFDDPDGNKVYDYSQTRKDGTLSEGATLTRDAKFGKALDINGNGECITDTEIPISGNFTLSLYVRPATKRIGWLLNFSGVDNYIEKWINVNPGQWIFLTFVRDGNLFTAHKDGIEVERSVISGNPDGFSINDDSLFGTHSLIDEVMLFDVAKSLTDILKIKSEGSDVEYYIDGQNFKDFGVYVSKSNGLIGMLERKDPLQVDWDGYHGIVVDTKRPRYRERTITLDCFIEASSKSSFVEWVQLFMSQFQKEDKQRLRVEYDRKGKPLFYEVFCQNAADVDKNWTYNDELMVGTFRLTLIEPEPVKRVIRHIGSTNSTAQIMLTSNKLLNIYWGDGTATYDVSGTNRQITHQYTGAGEYDIIITGVIEDIKDFETNCIVVWNKLL